MLVRAIDSLVGKRGRSTFIADAAQREVERWELLTALEVTSGSWKDENRPELRDAAAAWVAEQRREDSRG